jgi:hypothetical protein
MIAEHEPYVSARTETNYLRRVTRVDLLRQQERIQDLERRYDALPPEAEESWEVLDALVEAREWLDDITERHQIGHVMNRMLLGDPYYLDGTTWHRR